ncbi:MAG: prepilin-type N-terminal cleavage/methylation domain-containing protein [Candidatus Hinthialibacter antarcticus]|nr:prepilin-type N-terminal cleavage/methylation domain-containing protein [Candidatus Hinthialibacter antarcticus]
MKRNAFTLIELLIVVAIIGILAAIAVPNFLSAQIRAKIAKTESEMSAYGTAAEMYRLDERCITKLQHQFNLENLAW